MQRHGNQATGYYREGREVRGFYITYTAACGQSRTVKVEGRNSVMAAIAACVTEGIEALSITLIQPV